ncbi:MAG: hypothetical protein RL088_1086 [Verrucomicrobiota bacterium]|jgi:2-polyprenyl-3-methyl-5-hydroxy-6-metoxy-1,4-benzoquinol methylase
MTSPKEKIAVIVPVYGQLEFVIRCLKSLVRHTSDYRCFIIDDGSPDWNDAWLEEFKAIVPAERMYFEKFDPNRGLTAAWNRGLELARDAGIPYAALVNSDTLFSPGWLLRTLDALEKVDLVGPMSNAAGDMKHQQIEFVIRNYKIDDNEDAINELSATLKRKFSGVIKPGWVNGFWMAAKTDVWWANKFDDTHVFNPANRLTGNETEFQKRFKGKVGAAQDIFIFHYRSVSRGLENAEQQYCKGWFRIEDGKASGAVPDFNSSYVSRRSDLVAFIPETVKRVLDVGCSVGALGYQLKQRQGAYVAGIEYDAEMGKHAASVLDHVIVGDAETVSTTEISRGELFDCIVFADILEHLRDPWNTLARYASVLKPGGYVVTSLPNIRHFTTICNLLFAGYWPYRTRGIHDRTHLRNFTKRNIEELFEFANMHVKSWHRIFRIIEKPHDWNRFAKWFAFPPFRELMTFQYYVLAQK